MLGFPQLRLYTVKGVRGSHAGRKECRRVDEYKKEKGYRRENRNEDVKGSEEREKGVLVAFSQSHYCMFRCVRGIQH